MIFSVSSILDRVHRLTSKDLCTELIPRTCGADAHTRRVDGPSGTGESTWTNEPMPARMNFPTWARAVTGPWKSVWCALNDCAPHAFRSIVHDQGVDWRCTARS